MFIVLILEDKDSSAIDFQNLIEQTLNIKYKKHIRVVNLDQYLEFLDLTGDIVGWRQLSAVEQRIVSKFRWLKQKSLDSIKSDVDFEELIEESKHYSELLKII